MGALARLGVSHHKQMHDVSLVHARVIQTYTTPWCILLELLFVIYQQRDIILTVYYACKKYWLHRTTNDSVQAVMILFLFVRYHLSTVGSNYIDLTVTDINIPTKTDKRKIASW